MLPASPGQHRQPQNPPTKNAEHRHQISDSRAQFRLFGPVTRFQSFVEHFNFPAHGIPVELLDSFGAPAHWQVLSLGQTRGRRVPQHLETFEFASDLSVHTSGDRPLISVRSSSRGTPAV